MCNERKRCLTLCDSCFPQALTALLSDDSKFGFIVIDGSGALFGTLQGNTREVLHKFTVDLPKKHGKLRDICGALSKLFIRSEP